MSRLLPIVLLLSGTAMADRGALSIDVGGGGSASTVPAIGAEPPKGTLSFDASLWLGGRYALSHGLEISVAGFFEPPATLFQNDVNLVADSGTYPGTTRHQFMRFGAQAGVHLVFGMVVRFHLGIEAGWCQQMYSGLRHFDVSGAEAVDYGLSLPDQSFANLVVSPLLGLEWVAGDSWSLALMPRGQLMLGTFVSWAVVLPLQFSWSWYL